LIEHFEQEHQAAIAEAERRQALFEAAGHAQNLRPLVRQHYAQQAKLPVRPPPPPTAAQRAEAESEARRMLGERFPGVDLDLPGFKGFVDMEAEKILRKNAA
jgi:hypothetical protein